MASLQVDQLQVKNLFNDLVHSKLDDVLSKSGVTLNGNDPADLQIQDHRAYYRLFMFSMGLDPVALGECWMDKWWDCRDLIGFFEKFLSKKPSEKGFRMTRITLPKLMHHLSQLFFNLNNKIQSEKDISAHYDIGNDLYRLMLDRTMNYSCGYWTKSVPIGCQDASGKEALCESLEEAQMNKMLLIGRKLKLKPGMRVLDIGCGWGYLAKFLAINFGVHVVAVTISKEQHSHAKTVDTEPEELAFLRVPGLDSPGEGSFEFRLQDYRDVEETFDRIVSVGMFEHVGPSNYNEFFQVCRKCLKDDGLLLLHTIGLGYTKPPQLDAWTNKYIFPGGCIPYHTQIMDATLNEFLVEDWHVLGFDYYRTLCAWKANFDREWPKLRAKYGERFRRMWTFYLCGSAAGFKTRKYQLWQIVFSKRGLTGGYVSCR